MTDEQVKDWVNSFDTVMTDCDGVLWVGAEPIPGSPDVIQRLRQLGKRVFYVTNNSTKHRREYKTKVDKLGFGGDLEEIIGTAYLAAAYLEEVGFDKSKLVYVVGSTGITQELDDVGIKYLPIGVRKKLVHICPHEFTSVIGSQSQHEIFLEGVFVSFFWFRYDPAWA